MPSKKSKSGKSSAWSGKVKITGKANPKKEVDLSLSSSPWKTFDFTSSASEAEEHEEMGPYRPSICKSKKRPSGKSVPGAIKRAAGRPRVDPLLKMERAKAKERENYEAITACLKMLSQSVPGAYLCSGKSTVMDMAAKYVAFLLQKLKQNAP
ncbi:uncharacterized protein LOC131885373 isoform X2 [Tigriopus californicus]|uniref:uncharacterized protein LOC131885373 isoform X2 n=1 Tax=Tigriopus californicus TaxID=6832 RepID=UPI0027D9F3F8|nr:uncharacterized protein LOC131885373 isoform X2 [Tigriopus californicus]